MYAVIENLQLHFTRLYYLNVTLNCHYIELGKSDSVEPIVNWKSIEIISSFDYVTLLTRYFIDYCLQSWRRGYLSQRRQKTAQNWRSCRSCSISLKRLHFGWPTPNINYFIRSVINALSNSLRISPDLFIILFLFKQSYYTRNIYIYKYIYLLTKLVQL